MGPYPSRVHARADRADFTASLTLLNDVIETLSGTGMMSCSQAALEKYVTGTGRELQRQRQLMQDQLDGRARLEERRAVVCGADGVDRRRAEGCHRRLVATMVGRVEAERYAYRAPGAPNLHPADAVLELPKRLYL